METYICDSASVNISFCLYTHLSTGSQSLVGGLYVISYYEENLLTLQNKKKIQTVRYYDGWMDG